MRETPVPAFCIPTWPRTCAECMHIPEREREQEDEKELELLVFIAGNK